MSDDGKVGACPCYEWFGPNFVAINAILSASRPHSFLGINSQGRTAIVRTRGNRYGHVVLRGGDGRPNYDTVSKFGRPPPPRRTMWP